MKANQIRQASNIFINLFYLPLIFISLLGSLGLVLFTFNGLRPKPMWLIVFIVFIGLLVGSVPVFRSLFRDSCYSLYRMFMQHHRLFLIILTIVTIFWQFMIVYSLSGTSLWDPNTILRVATGRRELPVNYFSNYPNTLMLMYMEHGFWNLLGRPTMETLVFACNYVNILIVDAAAVMIIDVVRQWFGKKYIPLISLFTWSLFLISPWVALTYTDTWVFMLMALNLWLVMSYERLEKNWRIYLCAIALGLSFTMSYLIKPSLLVVYVAFAIIYVLRRFSGELKRKRMTLIIIPVALGIAAASGVLVGFKVYTAHQTLVTVNAKLAHPATHFIAMGMTGTGRYSEDDVQLDRSIKSPKKRQETNLKLIQQRLAAFGPTNYFKFLVTKQGADTADASFGWGNDGIFLIAFGSKHSSLISAIPRYLFTENGTANTNSFEYRFMTQLIWTVMLFFLLFAGHLHSWKNQLLKYGIVGAMVFLLIFEGGRSRYIIQFLPLFLILATISGKGCIEWLQRVLSSNK